MTHTPRTAASPLSPCGPRGHQSVRREADEQTSLWSVYRFRGYFQREVIAVFSDGQSAIDFAMANMSAPPNGVYVGEYAGDKPSGWLAAELSLAARP